MWRRRCADLTEQETPERGFGPAIDRSGFSPRRKGKGRGRRGDGSEAAGDGPELARVRRVCGAVARAVAMGLAGCGDERLHALTVERVEPVEPGSVARLRVVVASPEQAEEPRILGGLLAAVAPRLRAEVAGSLHRKRTPRLVFVVLPAVPLPGPTSEQAQESDDAGEGVADEA